MFLFRLQNIFLITDNTVGKLLEYEHSKLAMFPARNHLPIPNLLEGSVVHDDARIFLLLSASNKN